MAEVNCALKLSEWQAEIAAENWAAAQAIHDEMRANGCDDPVGVCGAPHAYIEHVDYLNMPPIGGEPQ